MKAKIAISSALLALSLVACGGDGGAPPPTNETLFTDANAWKGALPEGAVQVSNAEFRQKIASGESVLVTTASQVAQQAAAEQQYQDDLAYLKGLPNPSPAVQAVLAEAAANPQARGDRPVKLADGQMVVLLGLDVQVRQLADAQRLGSQSVNALAAYRLSYDLLPANLRAKAAAPESLSGQSAEAIGQASHHLDGLLANHPELLGAAKLDTSHRMSAQTVSPGNGKDNNGTCTPSGLAAKYWFPLKNFVSPMKDQANRGMCWDFTAIGALESRERVQNNNPANLSEQFLANKVKQDWDANDFVDGQWPEKALQYAVDKGQTLPSEGSWTYNRSDKRSADNDKKTYANTCDNYTGDCSNTTHQSREECTTFVFTFCSYVKVNYSGSGVAPSRAVQVWKSGDSFDLNRYVNLLANGHVLMASFPVYRGFFDDVGGDGLVSNYSKTQFVNGKEVGGSYGGHAVQIVGFLSNDDMRTGNTPTSIGGGGYFIIKNSWGCNKGDAGYYYIPADYISSQFWSLSTLDFDARRSDAWNTEQATPGGNSAPQINMNTSNKTVDLRVKANLTSAFSISHVARTHVQLTVTSDKDGTIYNGDWSTDPNLLVGTQLEYTFATEGTRTLTLSAKYGTTQANVRTLNVHVVNTAPTIQLQGSGNAAQGEDYQMTAVVGDINESNLSSLCSNTTWSVDAPDTVTPSTGCQVKVKFGSTGAHEVRATTRDTEGLTASASLTVNVDPPPVNPYPRITSANVARAQYQYIVRNIYMCTLPAGPQANGSTLNLNADPGTACNGQPNESPYNVYVNVENPSNEALTYTWTFWDTSPSHTIFTTSTSTPQIPYYPYSGGPCGVSVTVTPPEASRAKSQTVWSGTCQGKIIPPK